MNIRLAEANDADVLIKLRIDYILADWGVLTENDETAIRAQLSAYIPGHIGRDFMAVLAEEDGRVVSSAFLAVAERPANPVFLTGKVGTLLNVLTYPEYRRKGYALRVVSEVIEAAKKMGISMIELSATSDGKPLYEKLGFAMSNSASMRLKLK